MATVSGSMALDKAWPMDGRPPSKWKRKKKKRKHTNAQDTRRSESMIGIRFNASSRTQIGKQYDLIVHVRTNGHGHWTLTDIEGEEGNWYFTVSSEQVDQHLSLDNLNKYLIQGVTAAEVDSTNESEDEGRDEENDLEESEVDGKSLIDRVIEGEDVDAVVADTLKKTESSKGDSDGPFDESDDDEVTASTSDRSKKVKKKKKEDDEKNEQGLSIDAQAVAMMIPDLRFRSMKASDKMTFQNVGRGARMAETDRYIFVIDPSVPKIEVIDSDSMENAIFLLKKA